MPVSVPSLAALSDQALSGCCPCGSVCLCSSQCSAQGHGTTGAACPTALLWLHTLPLWVPSLLHSLGQASTVGFSVQTCLDSIRGGRGVSLSPQLAKVGQMSLFHQQLSIATDPLAWDTQFQLSCLKSGRAITPPAASGPSAGSFAPHPIPSVSEGSGVGFGRLLTQSAQEQFQAAGLCFCQDILSLSGQEGWCGQCPPCLQDRGAQVPITLPRNKGQLLYLCILQVTALTQQGQMFSFLCAMGVGPAQQSTCGWHLWMGKRLCCLQRAETGWFQGWEKLFSSRTAGVNGGR